MELRTLGILLVAACVLALPAASADGPASHAATESFEAGSTTADADTGPDPGNPCRPYCLM